MNFMYLNIHPTRLFGPTRLIGTWEYAVLAWPDHKIVLKIKAKQFYDQVMQELRKNREIQLNQQTIRC